MHRTIALVVALLAIGTCAPASAHDGSVRILVSGWSSSNVVAYDADDGAPQGPFVQSGSGGLSLAHSVRPGPDRLFYVTSVGTNQVLRYEPEFGNFDQVFVSAAGTPLSSPTDAIFGPDGDLYVASFNNGLVLKFAGTSGAYEGVFATGQGNGRVEMLAWGPDGNLYASTGNGHGIDFFDGATGASLGPFVSPGSGGLVDPHGFAFGPDGHLYVTSFGSPKVLKFNGTNGALMPDFAVVDDPGTPEDETGGLTQAHGIAFGDDGHAYVASFGTNSVMRFEGATGAFIDVFAQGGGLSQPTFIHFDDPHVPGDATGDGVVNVEDLVAVILAWGACPAKGECDADLNGDAVVDVVDLVEVVLNWG